MLIRKPSDVRASDITDEKDYVGRRKFLEKVGGLGLAALAGSSLLGGASLTGCDASSARADSLSDSGSELPDDKLTPYEDVTTYNNFYEFGTDKSDPAANAKNFRTKPWTLEVDGLVNKPATYHLEDFLKPYKL